MNPIAAGGIALLVPEATASLGTIPVLAVVDRVVPCEVDTGSCCVAVAVIVGGVRVRVIVTVGEVTLCVTVTVGEATLRVLDIL